MGCERAQKPADNGVREKKGRIPEALLDKTDTVLDDYSNPIEMLRHSFVCKAV
ncbi:MAG: hypothetical protein LBF89_05140 [Bacteroidales bacterium]|nr:hypothetical protein [Bacteroidales bacterium]